MKIFRITASCIMERCKYLLKTLPIDSVSREAVKRILIGTACGKDLTRREIKYVSNLWYKREVDR